MLNSRPISDPAPVNMDPQVWPQTLNMYFQTPKNGSLLKPAAKIKGTLSKDFEIREWVVAEQLVMDKALMELITE